MSEFDAEDFNVDELLAAVQKLQEETKEADQELSNIKSQYDEAEKLVRSLWRQREEAKRKKEYLVNEQRTKEKELARQQRFLDAKKKRDELKAEFAQRAKELDALTATAKWREFAYDHQIDGAKQLAIAKRGILGDKRGLGKTLTSLCWLDMIQANKVIVIAPNDVVPQFEEEIRTWAPHRSIFSLAGKPPDQRKIIYPMLQLVPQFIITLNYEAWRRDKTIIDDLVSAGIDTIICDEAHRIKSSNKITARGVFQIAYRPNYCAQCNIVQNYCGPWTNKSGRQIDYEYNNGRYTCPICSGKLTSTVENVLSMTGTPILNKPQELFSLLHLVNNIRFKSERQFLGDYCYPVGPNRWRFMSGGLDRLSRSMSEFFVQRDREDAGISIPPPAIKIYYIEKDRIKYKKQYKAEGDLRNYAALVLENGDTKSMLYLMEIILRERQTMTWPAGIQLRDPETREIICNFDVEESQKLDEACDLLSDLVDEEERVIVFSKFKAPLYEMRKRFAEHNMVVATGDQSKHLREQVVRDFDLKTAPENPRWQVVFATYDAFATGLNLNAARHIIMLDDEWSPGMEDQAIGRIDRLNSVDQANVHIFRVKHSIDDFMEGLIEEKKQLTEGFEGSLVTAAQLLDHLRGAS